MKRIILLISLFVPSLLWAQYDLNITNLQPTLTQAEYDQHTNIQFSFEVELMDGAFIPEGTELYFDFSIQSEVQFSSTYVLNDTLFNGNTVSFDSPGFNLAETGDFNYCVETTNVLDTLINNNRACESIKVIPLLSIPEIQASTIEVLAANNAVTIVSDLPLEKVKVYSISGQLLYEKPLYGKSSLQTINFPYQPFTPYIFSFSLTNQQVRNFQWISR